MFCIFSSYVVEQQFDKAGEQVRASIWSQGSIEYDSIDAEVLFPGPLQEDLGWFPNLAKLRPSSLAYDITWATVFRDLCLIW